MITANNEYQKEYSVLIGERPWGHWINGVLF